MSAFTDVTGVARAPAVPGGDGMYERFGTAKGTASYDTGGSVFNMSALFKSKCYWVEAYTDNADIRFIFVPAASYAAATGELFMDDNAGTEIGNTTDESVTCAVIHWRAIGTDA